MYLTPVHVSCIVQEVPLYELYWRCARCRALRYVIVHVGGSRVIHV